MTPHKDYFADIGFWPAHTGLRSYATGFVLSLLLVCAAYSIAVTHALPATTLALVLIGLALLQFIAQATYFLHLVGFGASRERLAIFAGALLVVSILVVGSLWIMFTLDARQMISAPEMEQYMGEQGGF